MEKEKKGTSKNDVVKMIKDLRERGGINEEEEKKICECFEESKKRIREAYEATKRALELSLEAKRLIEIAENETKRAKKMMTTLNEHPMLKSDDMLGKNLTAYVLINILNVPKEKVTINPKKGTGLADLTFEHSDGLLYNIEAKISRVSVMHLNRTKQSYYYDCRVTMPPENAPVVERQLFFCFGIPQCSSIENEQKMKSFNEKFPLAPKFSDLSTLSEIFNKSDLKLFGLYDKTNMLHKKKKGTVAGKNTLLIPKNGDSLTVKWQVQYPIIPIKTSSMISEIFQRAIEKSSNHN